MYKEAYKNTEAKIHFVFKIYTKVAFKRRPVCICFNESKIVTMSQGEGNKTQFYKKQPLRVLRTAWFLA